MRIVVQRVKEARVTVEGRTIGEIGRGVLVFFAVHKNDTLGDPSPNILWLVQKLIHLRIFSDVQGKMNLSLQDVQGEALIVSQFTLYGGCKEGRRPDFIESAPGSLAEPIYNQFVQEVGKSLGRVATGLFAADMQVSLVNDGPVTFIIDR